MWSIIEYFLMVLIQITCLLNYEYFKIVHSS